MDCKLVRQASISNSALSKMDDAALRDHILNCPQCEAYFDSLLNDNLEDDDLEKQLYQLFEKEPVPISLMKKVRHKRVLSLKQVISVAILCALVLLPFAYELVGSLPQFSKANETYQKNSLVNYAEKVGLPVEEAYFENEKYRLFVKDIVVNNEQIAMLVTIMDQNDDTPSDLKYYASTVNGNFEKINTVVMNDFSGAWAPIFLRLDDEQNVMESTTIKIEIENKLGEVLINHDFKVSLAHLKPNHHVTQILNRTYDLDGLKINLESIEVYETVCKIVYKHASETPIEIVNLDITMKDGKGNIYSPTGNRSYSSSDLKSKGIEKYSEVHFENVYFKDFINSLNIEFKGVNYVPLKFLGPKDALPTEFIYRDKTFNIVSEQINHKQSFVISSKYPIELCDFPILSGRKDGESVYLKNEMMSDASFELTEAMVKNSVELDDISTINCNKASGLVMEYVQDNYDVTLKEDELMRAIVSIKLGEEKAYVMKIQKTDKVIYTVLDNCSGPYDIYTIDYTHNKYKMLEKQDIFTIDLD